MKKNPKDATLRNTQAANKKPAKLAAELKEIKARLRVVEKKLSKSNVW